MSVSIPQTPVLATGEYPAVVTNCEFAESDFGPQVKITFELEAPHDQHELRGWASAKTFSQNTKLYRWTSAILGRKLAVDEPFQGDALIGERCVLSVSRKVGEKGTFNRIEDVLPVG